VFRFSYIPGVVNFALDWIHVKLISGELALH